MRRILALFLAIAAAAPATAALAPGAKAPNFSTQGAIAGKTFNFSLASALRKGPVVLYFFPAAFTGVCSAEAHEFAERAAEFKKAGATVVGVAADKIADLQRFSISECSSKFAVAVATPEMIKGYDVVAPHLPGRSIRTTFVIAPNGSVLYALSDTRTNLDFRNHVANTLKAVQDWKARRKK